MVSTICYAVSPVFFGVQSFHLHMFLVIQPSSNICMKLLVGLVGRNSGLSVQKLKPCTPNPLCIVSPANFRLCVEFEHINPQEFVLLCLI